VSGSKGVSALLDTVRQQFGRFLFDVEEFDGCNQIASVFRFMFQTPKRQTVSCLRREGDARPRLRHKKPCQPQSSILEPKQFSQMSWRISDRKLSSVWRRNGNSEGPGLCGHR
jgi:hypothetical protein